MPPKKKVVEEEVEDVEEEVEEEAEEEEPAPKKKGGAKPKAGGGGTRKKAKMLNDFEHCLQRPDTYVGSVKNRSKPVYLFDEETQKIVYKEIDDFNPGLLHIFKEVTDNAQDNIQDSKEEGIEQTYIEIVVNDETGETSVKNDGKFIYAVQEDIAYTDPVSGEKLIRTLYPAEAYFGYMRTGTNYDEDADFEHDENGELKYDEDGMPIPVNGTKIGKNGMGSKATSVLSKRSMVEHTDTLNGKKFKMEFMDNLTKRSKPKVTAFSGGAAYTKFTYFPDFERFGRESYGPNFIAMMKKMAYDIAFSTGIKVKFNGQLIKVKDITKYAELFFEGSRNMLKLESVTKAGCSCEVLVVEQTVEEAEEFGMRHVSFANGNYTRDGGIHVTVSEDLIFKTMRTWWNDKSKVKVRGKSEKAKEKAKEENKNVPLVKKGDLEKFFFLFVTCVVKKPDFNAQTKYYLEGPKPQPIQVEDKHFKKMDKWEFVTYVQEMLESRLNRKIKKTEGNKSGYVGSFGDKANDANYAGKATHKKECVLFITEGQSAKGMVDTGISLLENGQDYHGTFALKGKFLNVTNANAKQINANEEIQMIKKILGLHYGDDYDKDEDFDSVRYQKKIVLVADADDDGSHIEGLVYNFFIKQFPGLVRRGLIAKLPTPIIRARKGAKVEYFFTKKKFRKWVKKMGMKENDIKGWELKYYKGLGTLENEDVEYIFTEKLDYVLHTYSDDDIEAMNKGFNSENADDRKLWLHEIVYKKRGGRSSKISPKQSAGKGKGKGSKKGTPAQKAAEEEEEEPAEEVEEVEVEVDEDGNPVPVADLPEIEIEDRDELTMTEFVNHILINYHIENNNRSLPSVYDGFKESQRKIMYGCFMRRLFTKEMKVAQLAGFIANNTNYHHGEVNLFDTITKMAQGFVGADNIPLLIGNGNFGSRHSGGKNGAKLNGAAAARYLHTIIDPITRLIFREEDELYGVLKPTVDEGKEGEPEHYLPVIPMLLVNGAQGMGSGWSTTIPQYNPSDLIEWLLTHIHNKFECGGDGETDEEFREYIKLIPWYNGFTGEIVEVEEKKNTYIISGRLEEHPTKKDTFVIDELPVGMWTNAMKERLEKLCEEKMIDKPSSNHGRNSVQFEIKCKPHFTLNIENNMSCLVDKCSFNNLVALGENGVPSKYEGAEDLMKEFFNVRYKAYVTRRENMLKALAQEHIKAKNKYRYVSLVYSKKIDMRSFKDVAELEEFLENPTGEIEPFQRVVSGKGKAKANESEGGSGDGDGGDEANDGGEAQEDVAKGSFKYLTSMLMTSMTEKNMEKLKKDIEVIKAKHSAILKKKGWMMWKEDLEELKEAYKGFLVRRDWGLTKGGKGKGKGKGAKKTGKETQAKPAKAPAKGKGKKAAQVEEDEELVEEDE